MNIPQAIMYLFPQADPMKDFIVQDDSDGNGPYIAQWNIDAPQPTEEELQSAWDAMQPTPLQELESVKQTKINELNASCNATILSGYTSDALGEDNTYDFDYDAQINLGGMLNAITAGIAPETIVWKASGVPQPHTVEQFKQVFADGLEHKNNCIAKYWTLKEQVNASATPEEIEAITW